MITCEKLRDPRRVTSYLRRDVFSNLALIEAIEIGLPEVPREIWAAKRDEATIVGVMMVEDYSGLMPGQGKCPAIRVDSPKALAALVHQLQRGETYGFAVPATLREALLKELDEPMEVWVQVSMAVAREDLRLYPSPGEIRPLSAADKELTDRFAGSGTGGVTLSRWVEWAKHNPETQVVFGLVTESEVLAYVQFGWLLDNVWEIGAICTADEHRRKGYAKTLLAHASSQVLDRGLTPFAQQNTDNAAGIRTAQAAGYREVFRLFSCKARVKGPGA